MQLALSKTILFCQPFHDRNQRIHRAAQAAGVTKPTYSVTEIKIRDKSVNIQFDRVAKFCRSVSNPVPYNFSAARCGQKIPHHECQ
jgi:hypothetical protein